MIRFAGPRDRLVALKSKLQRARRRAGEWVIRKFLGIDETAESLRELNGSVRGLADVVVTRLQLDEAYSRAEQHYEIAQRRLAEVGETTEALGPLGACLAVLEDVERARDQLDSAFALHRQKNSIDRERFEVTHSAALPTRELTFLFLRHDKAFRFRDGQLDLGASVATSTRLDATAAQYEQHLEIVGRVLAISGETPQALRALSIGLQRLGSVHVMRGQLDVAQLRFEQGVEAGCRLLDLTGRSPQTLRDLNAGLERLGEVEYWRGQLDVADEQFARMLENAQDIVVRSGRTPETLHDVFLSLKRVEAMACARGLQDAALARAKQMLVVANEALEVGGRTTRGLGDLRVSLERLGDAEQARGNLEVARRCYEQQYAIARETLELGGRTPLALRALSIALRRLGNLKRDQGHLRAASRMCAEELEIDLEIIDIAGETLETLASLSTSLMRLGDVELTSGRPESAYDYYVFMRESGLKLQAHVGETPESLRVRFMSLQRLSVVEKDRARLPAAVANMTQALALLLQINTQLATWPSDANALAQDLVALARAGAVPVHEALTHRVELWRRLYEHIDLADLQVLEHAHSDVARFHAHWLSLALEHAPDRLPEVLGAMQGRKIAALVLDELEQQHGASETPELQRRVRRLRAELRRQALALRVIGGEVSGPRGTEDDSLDRDERGLSVSAEVWRAREAEYRATRAEYQACLAELAKQPGYEALQPPQMDAARLRHTLADGQALLIVLQPPAEGQTNSISQALLLRRDGHQLVPLPGLRATIARVRSLAKAPQFVVGKRYAASRKFDNGNPAQALSEAMAEPATEALDLADSGERSTSTDEAFWSPLAPHLQGLHTLHVVTHGELHMLPLAHEGPGGIHLYQYPGLVFYWLQHNASEPYTADAGLGLQVHSPAQGEVPPPIPFVHAEAQLARSLWSPVHTPLPLQQEASPRVVHLAGHGEAGRGQEAALLVGPQQTLGLHELLRSRLRPEVVYLSACLVGRTSEDLDGDPLGMVSAFFLRGARSVVAPLVPISDLYAPILAGLFHWELKRQDDEGNQLDASRALKQAKARLNSGDWPEEIVQRVRVAYAGTFGNEIAEILHGRLRGVDGRQLDAHRELMAAIRTWLFPVYSVVALTLLRDEIGTMCKLQGPDSTATWGAERLADMLVDARDQLGLQTGVKELLRYMMVYGAPHPST